MKLPSFPRKALEAELDLYVNGEMGKVSLSKDTRMLGWPTFKKVYNSNLNFGEDFCTSTRKWERSVCLRTLKIKVKPIESFFSIHSQALRFLEQGE